MKRLLACLSLFLLPLLASAQGPALAPTVPPEPTVPVRLWVPLVYKNRVVPRVVWYRNMSNYTGLACFENPTSHRIQVDRFTTTLIGTNGQVVGTGISEPSNLLWVLEPGEKMDLYSGPIPASEEVAGVQVDVDWHPTNEQFVNLTIVETEVITCTEYGTWHELSLRIRNDTDRVIHQATLLAYGEEPTPWPDWVYGDTRCPRWTGKSLALTQMMRASELRPGEEFVFPLTLCAGDTGSGWLSTDPIWVKCIARLSDTSLP